MASVDGRLPRLVADQPGRLTDPRSFLARQQQQSHQPRPRMDINAALSEGPEAPEARAPSTARQGRPAPRPPWTMLSRESADSEAEERPRLTFDESADHDDGVDLGETPAQPFIMPKSVLDVLEVVRSSLHVVYASAGQGTERGSFVLLRMPDGNVSSQPLQEPPEQAEAVLLLVDVMSNTEVFWTAIVEGAVAALKKFDAAPPIIALILRRDGSALDPRQMNTISANLVRTGVDDVLVQPRNKLDLQDNLEASLASVSQSLDVAKKLMDLSDDRANALFFQSITQIIPGFPRFNGSIEEKAPTRSSLGGVGRHDFVSDIGIGRYGSIYRTNCVTQKNEVKCEAVKVISKRKVKTPNQVAKIMNEALLLQKVSAHANIAKFSGIVHARRNLYLFLEFVGTETLAGVIQQGEQRRLSSESCLKQLLQMLDAVSHCHASLVAHRDINVDNIVFNLEGTPKLVDFGMSVTLSNEKPTLCTDMCGTIPFAAPEVYRGKEFDPRAVDVWCLGMLALEMRCGVCSVCQMLGCSPNVAANAQLAAVIELFFNPPDWPKSVQNLFNVGMAEELQFFLTHSLTIHAEDRWHAHDLFQHLANSSGHDRVTQPLPAGCGLEHEDFMNYSQPDEGDIMIPFQGQGWPSPDIPAPKHRALRAPRPNQRFMRQHAPILGED